MREPLNYDPKSGKFEEKTKLLEPLGIKIPLLPARILGQNWLQTPIVPLGLVSVLIFESYLGQAARRKITSAGVIANTTPSAPGNLAAPSTSPSSESMISSGDVELDSELPQLPQVLQNLAHFRPLVIESDFIHTQPAAQDNLAQTGQKTVKIASSDRLTFSPIPVPSNRQKTKPNFKLSSSTTATPAAWSSITDLLANFDNADMDNLDHPMPANPYLSNQPPIKTVITTQRTETFTQQITSPRRSSQKPDRRNLDLLAQEVYALIQQQLLLEADFHSQSSSGRLPW